MSSACPYCRSPFEKEDELTTCEACSTPHHADCYAENSGCTVFGCSNAPVDEPKINISVFDLTASTLPSTPSHRPTPPPPPQSGSSTSVPPLPAPLFFREDTTRYITPPARSNLLATMRHLHR